MAHPRLSVGVEVPNPNMDRKTDGLGEVGYPDGWEASALGLTDFAARWSRPQLEAGTYVRAPLQYGPSRAMRLQWAAGLASSAVRYVQSAEMPVAQLFGSQQMNGEGEGYWYYRLRYLFAGGLVSGGSASMPLSVRVDVYNETRQRVKSICTYNHTSSLLYSNAWSHIATGAEKLDNTGWSAGSGSTNPTTARVVIAWAGGTGTLAAWAAFTGFTLETLGPVDTTAGTFTLAALGDTYFELSKSPSWTGLRLGMPLSFAKIERLPSGRARQFDPSSGVTKRRFELPMRLLTVDDYKRLWLLWQVNRGYGFNGGSAFGVPMPLVLIPNQPDWGGTGAVNGRSFYVNWIGDTFPLEYDLNFQSAALSGFRYQGNLVFEER